uniref:Tetratricopeptide repeat protein 19, mitochondrial n=1 Tax=Aceria tosichella TaxID=561515 RepID=A0A6G1SJM7_9ACAR
MSVVRDKKRHRQRHKNSSLKIFLNRHQHIIDLLSATLVIGLCLIVLLPKVHDSFVASGNNHTHLTTDQDPLSTAPRSSEIEAQPDDSFKIATISEILVASVNNNTLAVSPTSDLLPIVDPAQDEHHHHHGNSNSSNKSDNGSAFLPFYVMFGVLGMFRKPSANELEEERVRLTDEQKMKKMKPVELAIAKGVLSMCDQNYDKANQLFHEALHMAQDENDEEQEELILNLIASNYFESGDFQNAEKLFIDLMKRMIAHDVAPTSPGILELSLKLASIYSKSPETAEKALKGFKFVISSLLNSLDDIVSNIEELDFQEISDEKKNELALLGWSYDWFAKHLLTMNDYSAAAIMLHKAYEISSKVLGPFHDQTLILLNDIGTTLAMNDSPDEGRKFMKKAVEGAITNNSSELASFYVNLGLVYLKLRDLKEAKQYCEYSMDLAKKNPEQYNSHDVVELSRTCLTHIERLLGTER